MPLKASKSVVSADTVLEQCSAASNGSISGSSCEKENAPSSNDDTKDSGPLFREPINHAWSQCTEVLHNLIRRLVVAMSGHAARNPKFYVAGITFMATTVLVAGLLTNFKVEVDYEIIYAPHNSRPTEHMNWIDNEAGFPASDRPFALLFHNHGNNVLSKQGVRQIFEVLDVLENTEGYSQVCGHSGFTMTYKNGSRMENMCNIIGVTRFWYYNQSIFEETETSDQQVMQTISNETYPDGVPVNHDFILGKYQRNNSTIIEYAESITETILVPDCEGADEWELAAIENLLQLQERWKKAAAAEISSGHYGETMQFEFEFFTLNSYATEFERAIFKDLPLTLLVALIMIGFTCIVFFKRDKVQSRSLLGISSVHTITMSVFMGHGLMFLIGVPYTNMTMMLPFVVYGVGLDDTFIITGAYFRTDQKKPILERINYAMNEVGQSISLTTITTMLAFALGALSSIPAIQWLCLYAFVTIGLDFIFQITLFTAFLVLDEQRVQANRRDICFCMKVEREDENTCQTIVPVDGNDVTSQASECQSETKQTCQSEVEEQLDIGLRFMTWYADFLMRPSVKIAVLGFFASFFGFCVYRTTLMTQEFIISDFLPSDSYVSDFLTSVDDYSSEMVPLGIYFRHLNQSDATVQEHMRNYIDDLMSLEQLDVPPPVCWVRDFHEQKSADLDVGIDLELLSFNDQLNLAMTDPRIQEVYGNDIIRAENGDIVSSRCWVYLSNVDFDVVQSQVDMLKDQRAITASQPLNQNKEDWSMFTFDSMYIMWEFYSVCVDELIYTTIFGVVAVSIVAFILMPHWTAIFFVFPTICVLYVDLLGTLQLAGLHINAVTYVCLTVSIGLLVDFIMHILLRYYESVAATREEKVKDTLKTMGVSIMVGGLSTFLAVIPLALSTSDIMGTIFKAFFSMITLGVAHGLIFLPVVLSLVGPTMTPLLHPSTVSTKLTSATEDSAPSIPAVSHDIDDPNFVEIYV